MWAYRHRCVWVRRIRSLLANSEGGDCGEFGVPVNLSGLRPKVKKSYIIYAPRRH